MRYVKSFNILLLLVFLSGCAANIQQDSRKPVLISGHTVKHIHIDVSHSKDVAVSTDLANVTFELKQLISGKYSGVVSDSSIEKIAPDKGIGVYISIEHLKYVSSVERFMVGVLAGDAELRLDVKLIELSSGRVLGESVLDTRSKKMEGIFGATTSRQLEAVAQRIVEDVHLSQTSG